MQNGMLVALQHSSDMKQKCACPEIPATAGGGGGGQSAKMYLVKAWF